MMELTEQNLAIKPFPLEFGSEIFNHDGGLLTDGFLFNGVNDNNLNDSIGVNKSGECFFKDVGNDFSSTFCFNNGKSFDLEVSTSANQPTLQSIEDNLSGEILSIVDSFCFQKLDVFLNGGDNQSSLSHEHMQPLPSYFSNPLVNDRSSALCFNNTFALDEKILSTIEETTTVENSWNSFLDELKSSAHSIDNGPHMVIAPVEEQQLRATEPISSEEESEFQIGPTLQMSDSERIDLVSCHSSDMDSTSTEILHYDSNNSSGEFEENLSVGDTFFHPYIRQRSAKDDIGNTAVIDPTNDDREKKCALRVKSVKQKQRKKMHNRKSAAKYRTKKKQENCKVITEAETLEKKNAALKSKVEDIQKEINVLKSLMVDVVQARVKNKSEVSFEQLLNILMK